MKYVDCASPTRPEWRELARAAIDAKAKPPGSLGRLEDLAVDLCTAQKTLTPTSRPAHFTLFVADHGVALSGVTAWPQAVTRAVAVTTLAGGSGCASLAKSASVPVEVFDVGLCGPTLDAAPHLFTARVRDGSRDMSREPALSAEEFREAVDIGRTVARDAAGRGARVLIAGEAGIGNTTAACCLTAYLTGAPPEAGQGAGAAPGMIARKQEVIVAALARAKTMDGEIAIASICGLEIAAMAGFYAEGARAGCTLLLDGAVTAAAALIAETIEPGTRECMIAAHLSPEPCHAIALAALGLKPYLDWGLRLGEGTGALLMVPMLDASAGVMRDMVDLKSVTA